ncbi:hypothetical protein [Actinocrinis sp.]|uniref:hypothetical protein n=1 Tax=Actinocrinis sp. TaxID=1920516 RepID=UPI002D729AE9|nr:hypothetical protein [Actinocrinis sp.]HZP54628.1 hypothetical protein [Actinocrinis sp.]
MAANTVAEATDTQCPAFAWCTVNHSDPNEGHDYHYSHVTHVGPHAHALEILLTGQPVVSLYAAGETEYLDLDELGALIAALAGRWAELAALQARLTLAGAR